MSSTRDYIFLKLSVVSCRGWRLLGCHRDGLVVLVVAKYETKLML